MPPHTWTPELVLRLAADEASRKNAGELADRRRWLRLHRDRPSAAGVIWGECRGSSADPYHCQVDLGEPGFHCTCPSRKRPCKHTLGLFLLYAGQPGAFEVSAPPDWVAAWMAKRVEQGERNAARQPAKDSAPDEEARERRAAARDRKIRAGLAELETWLGDLLRGGLAAAQSQPRAFWEQPAARLVDAQAPGLARLLRGMADMALSGEGWQERMIAQLARLALAVDGYRRIDTLPEDTRADLRTAIGFTLRREDVLERPGIRDTWLVLGVELEEEARLLTRRTWLVGLSTGRTALLLSFSPAFRGAASTEAAGLLAGFAPGNQQAMDTELVFYPGAYPLRALARDEARAVPVHSHHDPTTLPGCESLLEATQEYAAALAANPWLERFPMLLRDVTPLSAPVPAVRDAAGRWIPLNSAFQAHWTLQAISGGRSLNLFGAWDGMAFQPLSAWNNEVFHLFLPAVEKP